MIITNDHHCPEGKPAAALKHLGCAGDMHHALVELIALFVAIARPALPVTALALALARSLPITVLPARSSRALPLHSSIFAWHQTSN
jgi:hypothetical protein